MARVYQIIHLLFALIYTLIGFSAFAVFIYFKNYTASVLGLITGIVSAFLCHLHVLKIRRTLTDWYSEQELKQLNYLGLMIFSIGGMCLTFFLIEEIWFQRGIYPISKSLVIPIIFSIITMKSAIMLWYYVAKFRSTIFGSDTVPCIVPNEVAEDLGIVDDSTVEAEPPVSPQNDPQIGVEA